MKSSWILWLVLLSPGVIASVAHAIPVCTASDIRVVEGNGCPANPAQDCRISNAYEVSMSGCVFDFGTQNVRIEGGGSRRIDAGGHTGTVIRARSITMEHLSEIRARGTAGSPNGGDLTIETLADFVMANSAKIDVAVRGDNAAGEVFLSVGGDAAIEGAINADAEEGFGDAGSVSVFVEGDLLTAKVISARNPTAAFSPGSIRIVAGGSAVIGGLIDVSGGDGGEIFIETDGELVVDATLDADATGDAGFGGSIEVLSARGVSLNGELQVRGARGRDQSGGSGGSITVDAMYGDIRINANAAVDGASPDGDADEISLTAAGSVRLSAGKTVSARADGRDGSGGTVTVEADVDVSILGTVEVSGGFGGGEFNASAGRDTGLSGTIDARGRTSGADGGIVFVDAGRRTRALLAVSGTVDAGGGNCNANDGCGAGGSILLSGCDVDLVDGVSLRNRGADAGGIDIEARGQLRILPTAIVNATTNIGATEGEDGSVRFAHPASVPPLISPLANIRPAAEVDDSAGLVPCAICGNGTIEDGETCDDGNTQGCDGCSFACEVEDCDDGNLCSVDRCENLLGCASEAVPLGTPCCDGTRPRNCNELNEPCRIGVCNPVSNTCEAVPRPDGTACSDGLTCTTADVCLSGVCGLPPDTCSCAGQENPLTDPCFGVVAVCGGEGSACRVDLVEDTSACPLLGLPTISCCGNGTLDPGESCDLGGSNSDAPDAFCRADCTDARCGDGIIDPGRGESCDDGNLVDSKTCTAGCRLVPVATATPSPTASATATPIPTASAASTATATSAPTPTRTTTPTASATYTATRSATATSTPIACPGDCSADEQVTVDEIVRCTNIALGNIDRQACLPCDFSGDGAVTVDEVISAVNAALAGCGRRS